MKKSKLWSFSACLFVLCVCARKHTHPTHNFQPNKIIFFELFTAYHKGPVTFWHEVSQW